MTTKLTLTVEESVIKKAKSYAISPKLKKLAGSVRLPQDFDEKLALNAYFENKHL